MLENRETHHEPCHNAVVMHHPRAFTAEEKEHHGSDEDVRAGGEAVDGCALGADGDQCGGDGGDGEGADDVDYGHGCSGDWVQGRIAGLAAE